jgi:hypothetical protein
MRVSVRICMTFAAALLTLPVFAADQVVRGGRLMSAEEAAALVPDSNASGQPGTPDEFGSSTTILNLGPGDFTVRGLAWGDADIQDGNAGVRSGASSVFYTAPVHLPSGVQVTGITIFYSDTDPANNPSTGLWRNSTTGVPSLIQALDPSVAFSGGNTSFSATLAPVASIDNLTNDYMYFFRVNRSTATPSQELRIYRVQIRYRRVVRPGPATATFTDVPTTSIFFQFIEALAAAGITGGCTTVPGGYCPGEPVTRAQMAAFLSIALGLHWPN